MSTSHALEARDLNVRFGDQAVLNGFSMVLQAGEKALLTGPSGGGKSTVLRCLLGFVAPQAGSVHVHGQELTSEAVWELRRHLAYVGQEPDLGIGTVAEVLERPFHFRANAALRKNLSRIPELFEHFGLAEPLLAKETSSLSGGEKQRVALVSALLLDRNIFLLDEVTSALDTRSRQLVVDYFRSREEATVLFVAHESDLFAFVDQVVDLQTGRPSEGTP